MRTGQHRSPAPSCLWLALMAAALAACACNQPSPGVLTLAPAGLSTTGACTKQPDGTLIMPAGATASAVVYVDAGAVTITITASAASLAHRPQVELWVAGDRVGTLALEGTAAQALPFHVHTHSSAPTALRIVYRTADDAGDEPPPTLHLEKVVVTEP